jgi:uncharacterized protein YaeQ
MAIKSTIFKVDLELADLDRDHFADYSLTIARHPSETDERMMIRLLAFMLHASATLVFGRGLSTEDEADLRDVDVAGNLERWIDVGLPDEKAIRRACGRSRQVVVVSYGGRGADIWWRQNSEKLATLHNLRVLSLSPGRASHWPAWRSEACVCNAPFRRVSSGWATRSNSSNWHRKSSSRRMPGAEPVFRPVLRLSRLFSFPFSPFQAPDDPTMTEELFREDATLLHCDARVLGVDSVACNSTRSDRAGRRPGCADPARATADRRHPQRFSAGRHRPAAGQEALLSSLGAALTVTPASQRRQCHMRFHTATHLLCALFRNRSMALDPPTTRGSTST